MNKLFTKIAAVVLGATMAVGVGVAVAVGNKASEVRADTTDVIDHAFTGLGKVSSGSAAYTAWSNRTGTSGAKYAGQSYKFDKNFDLTKAYIQIRKTSPAGIVSTTSGGNLSRITLDFSENQSTIDARYVEVYGKTTAYSGSSDLYADGTKGTYLGKFTKVANSQVGSPTAVSGKSSVDSGALAITGSYQYIGLLASAALYVDNVSITWTTQVTTSVSINDFAGTYKTNYITPGQSGSFGVTWSPSKPTVTSESWAASGENAGLLTLNSSTGAFTASSEVTEPKTVTVTYTADTYSSSKDFTICPHALDTSVNLSRSSLKDSFTIDDPFTLIASSSSHLTATFLDVGEKDVISDQYGGTINVTIDNKPFNIGDPLIKAHNGKTVRISYTFGEDTVSTYNGYSITVGDKDVDHPSIEDGWNVVTDASTLKDGDHIIIAAPDDINYAIGVDQSAGNRPVTSITKSNDASQLTSIGDAAIFTVKINTSGTGDYKNKYLFYGPATIGEGDTNNTVDDSGNGYLWASTANSGSNFLRTKATTTASNQNQIFDISISNKEATISLVAKSTRYIAYNSAESWFAAYVTNTQAKPYIYKQTSVTNNEFLQDWVYNYLKFQTIAIADEGDGSTCKGNDYYLAAKVALMELESNHSGCINLLRTGEYFANAKARYEAWALANGDTEPYSGTTIVQASTRFINSLFDETNGITPIVIVVTVGVASLTAVGMFFFLKKRREQN